MCDNTTKLKRIFANIIKKYNDELFYCVLINGEVADLYNKGEDIIIKLDNSSVRIKAKLISDVTFDSDICFAEFNYLDEKYYVDIAIEMTANDIFNKLL